MARPQRPVSKALPLFVCEVNSFPCTEVRHETRCERNQRKEGRKEGRPSRQDSSNGEDQCESKKYKSSRRSTKQNTYIKKSITVKCFLFNLKRVKLQQRGVLGPSENNCYHKMKTIQFLPSFFALK